MWRSFRESRHWYKIVISSQYVWSYVSIDADKKLNNSNNHDHNNGGDDNNDDNDYYDDGGGGSVDDHGGNDIRSFDSS